MPIPVYIFNSNCERSGPVAYHDDYPSVSLLSYLWIHGTLVQRTSDTEQTGRSGEAANNTMLIYVTPKFLPRHQYKLCVTDATVCVGAFAVQR